MKEEIYYVLDECGQLSGWSDNKKLVEDYICNSYNITVKISTLKKLLKKFDNVNETHLIRYKSAVIRSQLINNLVDRVKDEEMYNIAFATRYLMSIEKKYSNLLDKKDIKHIDKTIDICRYLYDEVNRDSDESLNMLGEISVSNLELLKEQHDFIKNLK